MAKKMTIGEIRTQLTADMFNDVDRITSENKLKTDVYYILQLSRLTGNNLVKTYMLISQEMLDELRLSEPHKFIGTTCHRVDNKAGRCDLMWVLPFDYPMDHVESAVCAGSQFIAESAASIAPAISNL